MLKVGTVFSGIGAIEHALDRLGVPYQIMFACDNGDVDILSKDIDESLFGIEIELNDMKKACTTEYNDDILSAEKELSNLEKEIRDIDIDFVNVLDIFQAYKDSGAMNDNQLKDYTLLTKLIENKNSKKDVKVFQMKFSVKLEVDIKRSELKDKVSKNLTSKITSSNSQYKKCLKKLRLFKEKVAMLSERINTEKIKKHIFSMKSIEEQKEYVDGLYAKYEAQNKVKQSYMANYSIENKNFHWNVSFLDGKNFKNQIDLFVGGSPCQSFSLVGKQRGLEDTRGTLFYEYARLVGEIKPKVFIYENVKAILSNDNGRTWETISRIFEELGYDWKYQVLNARDYGIPQNRERLFVVGFRKDLKIKDFAFPEKIDLLKTMKDFLLDNVSGKYYLPKKGVDFVTSNKNLEKRYTQIDGEIQLCQKKNQQFNWHGDFVFEEENVDKEKLIDDLEKYFLSEKVKKYVLSTGTKGFYSKPEIDLDIARPLLQSMHKMHRAGVDNYVTTDGRLRKLTPRECLRLMGFCDSFKIVVSDTSAYQQSGNSIVVDVLMHIVKEIFKAYPMILGGRNG